jgi:probable phosphoglycerate mutase
MRIVFIRHGEPDYAQDSLTEKGFREAALLGQRAAHWRGSVDAVYVSPLGRAQKTAQPVCEALGLKGQTLPWLEEFRGRISERYGSYEGLPWDFMPADWTRYDTLYQPEQWFTAPPMEATPGQPSVAQVYAETCRGLDALLAQYGYVREGRLYRVAQTSDKTIVCVCHMAITCAMLSHLLGLAFTPLLQGVFLPPTSLTILNSEERQPGIAAFRCQCIGDTRHLQAGDEPISASGYFAVPMQG